MTVIEPVVIAMISFTTPAEPNDNPVGSTPPELITPTVPVAIRKPDCRFVAAFRANRSPKASSAPLDGEFRTKARALRMLPAWYLPAPKSEQTVDLEVSTRADGA